VAENLPPGSALVAYVLYARYEMPREHSKATKRKVQGDGRRTPTPSYLAFVLGAGSTDAVVVPLGPAREIETMIAAWQSEAARGAFVSGRSAGETLAAYRVAGDTLRRKVWDPVAARLGDAGRVFVVPDGAINLVSLASLPVGEAEYLIERAPVFHHLAAERDLIPTLATRANGKGLLAMGGPAFDDASPFASLSPRKPEANDLSASLATAGASSSVFRGERSGCGDFRSIHFSALPGSTREVAEIAGLWLRPNGERSVETATVDELTGPGASEAAFKRDAPGHRTLHLATHGFFLSGRCASALDASRGVAGLVTADAATLQPVVGENPLLLSGLALAGANHRDAAGPDEEDGILSAEEIAALDLSGVEWAVLSACDTGVGEIRSGEGVFGLRRAFQVAGVKSLIMSLWSVGDDSTRSWMKALYEGRLESNLDTAAAVRHAGLEVLNDRRKRKMSTHPFYWAGFVAAGDWH